MKRLLFLGLGSALLFTMGGVGPAQADGGQHISTASAANTAGVVIANAGAGRCASCHRAHTAKAEFLLKEAQPQLCYSCHGYGGAITNVVDGTSLTKGALRGGGFNKAAIGSGLATKNMGALDESSGRIATSGQTIPVLGGLNAAPIATTSKHQIDGVTAGTAWGNGVNGPGLGKTLTLECGSCHDPHGNGNYRILRPMPVDSQWEISPAVPAGPGGVPVAIKAVLSPVTNVTVPDVPSELTTPGSHVYTTTNYWLTGDAKSPVNATSLTGDPKVSDLSTDGYIQNIAAWCTTCHTRYLAPTQSYKTPSGDPTFMYRHRSDANYKQGAANCITCHVSHGSNADAGGVADPSGGSAASSRLLRVDNRGTCVMCHNV